MKVSPQYSHVACSCKLVRLRAGTSGDPRRVEPVAVDEENHVIALSSKPEILQSSLYEKLRNYIRLHMTRALLHLKGEGVFDAAKYGTELSNSVSYFAASFPQHTLERKVEPLKRTTTPRIIGGRVDSQRSL